MGYWELKTRRNDNKELTDVDREHIANMIKEGYTSGEIVEGD